MRREMIGSGSVLSGAGEDNIVVELGSRGAA